MRPPSPPLSAVDAAWLRMDRAVNPMVITVLFGFAGRLGRAALDPLVARLCAVDRFRQRVAPPRLGVGLGRWEEDGAFDPARHVHRVGLPAPGDEAALAELVSDIASTPLPADRPLWALHVIERDEGDVLVARLHHAMGDGVALVRLLLAVLGMGAPAPEVGRPPDPPTVSPVEFARRRAGEAAALGELLLLPRDPRSPLKGPQSGRKRLAWSAARPLDRARAAAKARGVTLNDLMLAATAGALRTWFAHHGGPESGEVRALVPVFLRDEGAGANVGNHFGLVFLPLPTGEAAAPARLARVHHDMRTLKASPLARVAFGILGAMGVASEDLEQLAVDIFARKGSLLVTNVPGPPMPIELAGLPVHTMLVWAPVAGEIGLSLSLLSYAGAVRLGVSADPLRMPDPEAFVAAWEAAMAELDA